MSTIDPDIAEILRHAIASAMDDWRKDKLEAAVHGIHKALERAGYQIARRSAEEQEQDEMMRILMGSKPSKAQRAAIDKIMANGGEAIKAGWCYMAGGKVVCDRLMMERMALKKLVRLETVGDSTFAIPIT